MRPDGLKVEMSDGQRVTYFGTVEKLAAKDGGAVILGYRDRRVYEGPQPADIVPLDTAQGQAGDGSEDYAVPGEPVVTGQIDIPSAFNRTIVSEVQSGPPKE